MAQVGRISGGLLEANLLRKGVVPGSQQNLTFSNIHPSSGGTPLLHLNVVDGRIGVITDNPSASADLQVVGTTRVTGTGNMYVNTNADIAYFNIQNSTIQPFGGTSNIILNSAGVITSTNSQTEELNIDNNVISTINSNANLELRPNGSGSTEVFANLDVNGNLHSFSNITAEGNITFGDGNNTTDRVIITADISSDLIPAQDNFYSLGSVDKKWTSFESVLLNGQTTTADNALIGGVFINSRQGKTWFVSKNGDNSNVGDHPQGPFETIDYAVTQAVAGDTIYVYPGVYEETCPIEIPAGVTLHGHDQRNTIIEPASSQSTTDIFLLNGETALTNFTIRNFYYDNINDIGYAFRFAPGGKVTSRSPYIQNITVRTQGSTVTASDPLGFASGDAGRGILADGAVLASDTKEASLLFHAITLIVPNADALVMTNGVRIEWLNSFTYYANRGFYATNGTGRVDNNLQTRYGAEVRSIGSANIYGNYGAVADGADTLMYLIMHNFGYVGTGADSSNDNTLTIQENEVVETNNGRIQYQSQAHNGDFRVGDNFLIDFTKGSQTFNINDIPVVGVDTITITTGTDVTYLDLQYVQTGNVRLIDNSLASINGDMNIAAASGLINLDGNVRIEQNLDVSGNLTIGGTLIGFGNNQSLDTITFEAGIDTSLLPKTTDSYDIGSTTNRWDDVWLTQVFNDNFNITNNFIETTQSNSDLELRASGTGKVLLSDNVVFDNALTVTTGLTTLLGSLSTTSITLNNGFTQTGNLSIVGNVSLTETLTVNGSTQFEDILVSGNVVSTTLTNSNLELRANGTGNILIPNNNVTVTNNLTVTNTITANDYVINAASSAEVIDINDINILDNNITATAGDLELAATGDVVVDANNVQIDNDLTVTTGLTTVNNNVSVTGTLTNTGNYVQTGNRAITGNLTVTGVVTTDRQAQLENILIDDNFITTTQSNSDLELRASGTGEVVLQETVNAQQNLTVRDVVNNTLTAVTITSATLNTATATIAGNKILSNTGNLELSAFTGSQIVVTNNTVAEQDLTVTTGSTLTAAVDITGSLTQTGNRSQVGNFGITGDTNIVGNIDVTQAVQLKEILVDDNTVTTTTLNTDLELRASGTGEVVVPSNDVVIENDLAVNNSITLTSVTSTGNVSVEQYITDQLVISDNTVTTTQSNADLILRANGIGTIYIPSNNVQIDNDLTVSTATDLRATTITGSLLHTGNRTQTGNYNLTGNATVSNLLTVPNIDFESIDFDENVITTIDSNSDLELRAAGTGTVNIQNNFEVVNNVTVNGSLGTQSITSNTTIDSNQFINSDLIIDDNNINVTTANTDLILNATGVVNFENASITQTLDVDGLATLANTNIVGTFTTIGDLVQTGNRTITGNIDFRGKLTVDREIEIEDISINDNVITTTVSSADLELRASGTGEVVISDLEITNNLTNLGTFNAAGIVNSLTINSYAYETSELELRNNILSNTVTDNDLVLNATGIVNINTNTVFDETLTVDGITTLSNTQIVGTITHIGARDHVGNLNITGSITTASNLTVDSYSFINDIKIDGNLLRTTAPNANLILEAAGVGVVEGLSSAVLENNLTVVGTINSNGIQNISLLTAEDFNTARLRIYDNNIDATGLNSNIVLDASGTGIVSIDSNDVYFGGTLTADVTTLSNTDITGDITHLGNRTENNFLSINGSLETIGNLSASIRLDVDDVSILSTPSGGTIQTVTSNADLELRADSNLVIFNKRLNSLSDISADGNVQVGQILTNQTTTATAFETNDISITGSVVESISTGTDLELISSGNVQVPSNDVEIDNNLTVSGTTTFNAGLDVTGTISHTGNRTVNDLNIDGDLTVTGNIVAAEVQFEEINVNDNVVTTTSTNADLELRANGTGDVQFDIHARIAQNLAVNGVTTITDLTVQNTLESERFETDAIEIYDNRIQTTQTNADLELRTSGTGSIDLEDINVDTNIISSTQDITISVDGNINIHGTNATQMPAGTTAEKTVNTAGDIRFNTDDGVFEGYTTVPVTFAGVYSADRQTSVTADTASNELRLNVNGNRAATISSTNFAVNGLILPTVDIQGSSIFGTVTNTDVTISNGTGVVNIEELTFENTKIFNNANDALVFSNNGGFTVLSTTTGIQIPAGGDAARTSVEIGDTRWNTDSQVLETYDGNVYISSAGTTNNITPEEFNDLLFEYTLIFG